MAALAPVLELTVLAPASPRGAPPPAGLARLELYRPPGLLARAVALVRAARRGLPLQNALFGGADLERQLRQLAPAADVVILSLLRLVDVLPAVGERSVVLDLIDSLALNLERRAHFDRPWLRPLLRWEAARLGRWEARALAAVGSAWVVAERDRAAILGRLPAAEAARLGPRLRVVPLPVAAAVVAKRPATGPVLALTGNLGYFPTHDGARFFLREVWPVLAARHPTLRLRLAGARPPRQLRVAVARAGGRVELLASPPDLGAVLASATLAVAPLRAGSGQPLKVLEAWAQGVPVVASRWAAAGTTAVPGEDLAVADSPAEWVAAIDHLLADPAERERLAAAGRARLVADYARGAIAARLQSLLVS